MTADGDREGSIELIGRYNDAWNRHDLDAIVSMHAPGMVFENHTASRPGPTAFSTRRLLACEAVAVCERTADAAHSRPLRRGELVAEPTGRRLEWRGVDIFTFRDGLIARKDVYSDSMAILRGAGLLD